MVSDSYCNVQFGLLVFYLRFRSLNSNVRLMYSSLFCMLCLLGFSHSFLKYSFIGAYKNPVLNRCYKVPEC